MPSGSSGGAFVPESQIAIRQTVTPLLTNGPIPIASGIVVLKKATATAGVLRAPAVGEEGTELTLTSGSAAAHVVVATGLIQDGITGGAKSTLTFAAFLGATITLQAINRFWHVKSINAVVIT